MKLNYLFIRNTLPLLSSLSHLWRRGSEPKAKSETVRCVDKVRI
jgi:hypothetical protein